MPPLPTKENQYIDALKKNKKKRKRNIMLSLEVRHALGLSLFNQVTFICHGKILDRQAS